MDGIRTTTESEPEQPVASTIHCPQCGNELPEGARFCGVCGKQLREKKAEQAWLWLWPVIITLSAIAAYLAATFLPGTLETLVIIMWFLFVCPGMALARLLRLQEPVMEWVLALALSFAIDGIIAGILVYTGAWLPMRTLAIISGVCAVGVSGQLIAGLDLLPGRRVALLNVQRMRGWAITALLPVCCVLLFIGAIVAAYTWSPVYTALSAKAPKAQTSRARVAHPSATPTVRRTPSAPASAVDAVIVVDDVNLISTYDPGGDRFAAARLFVSLAPVGSRIGIVRITGSSTPRTILSLQAINSSSERNAVEGKLSAASFGSVDSSPTAYFMPALQTAATMLGGLPATDRKYVILITDELAYSGDQNACPSAPDIDHHWFCEVNLLHQQKVPVVLVAFTNPGGSILLEKQYIEARGGTVLPVTDNTNLIQYLTPIYTDLLTGNLPNV